MSQRGKTILRAGLVTAAIAMFAHLYALIRARDADPREVQFSFAALVLLLAGMPILR
jgi:hypothetical protein